ncbi:kinase-like protein [Glonium stellatum]|uniref:Kinase-like protein n=1 Tax=Glonium stellatum TaxID=574774 RepID=A0A8E2FDC8_9PEZI|nr:kinase-like protein [Glonium stellatum]
MTEESLWQDAWPLVPMEEFLDKNERDKFKWNDYLKSLSKTPPDRNSKAANPRHARLPSLTLTPLYPMVFRKWLGKSSKAFVYGCVAPPEIYENYKRPLAVKVIYCHGCERPMPEALEEVRNMENIEHCHIVSYVASYELDEQLGIIMYPPAKCNLEQYMNSISEDLVRVSQVESGTPQLCISPENRQKIQHLYRFFGCLSEAVYYLQQTTIGIKHKDIKPANIVIDHFNSALLTDFGIAHRYASPEEAETTGYTKKTEKYAYPEALDEENRDYSADIFSLGCVFLEIATLILEKSLDNLRFHRIGGGGSDPGYARTLSKVPSWIDMLRAKHSSINNVDDKEADVGRQEIITSVIGILPFIERMMDKERKSRPSAHDLCERFRAMYSEPCRSCVWRPREQKMPTPNQSPPVLFPNSGSAKSAETTDKTRPLAQARKPTNLRAKVIFYDPLDSIATIKRLEEIKDLKTTRVRYKRFRRVVRVKIAGQQHSVIDLKKLGLRNFLRCFFGDISYIHILREIDESPSREGRSDPG